MPVSDAWLLSERHHVPTTHSFFHICSDLHCRAVWAGSRSLGAHLSPHPTHLVVFKAASFNTQKAFGPVGNWFTTFSICCIVVFHFEAFTWNPLLFLTIMATYRKCFRSMLPLQNSVLDCKAVSPEGMHPHMVYFTLLVSSSWSNTWWIATVPVFRSLLWTVQHLYLSLYSFTHRHRPPGDHAANAKRAYIFTYTGSMPRGTKLPWNLGWSVGGGSSWSSPTRAGPRCETVFSSPNACSSIPTYGDISVSWTRKINQDFMRLRL